MTRDDQNKILRIGFVIVRKCNHPTPRIKVRTNERSEFKTLAKFATVKERDEAFKVYLQKTHVVED